jgi:AP-4 complex subunit epsilon-1
VCEQVIAEKLLDYLRTASDEGQKAEVAKRIGELAERFAPDTQWFIDTMNKVSLATSTWPSLFR